MGTAHAEAWGHNGPGTFQKQEKVNPATAVFVRMLGGTASIQQARADIEGRRWIRHNQGWSREPTRADLLTWSPAGLSGCDSYPRDALRPQSMVLLRGGHLG